MVAFKFTPPGDLGLIAGGMTDGTVNVWDPSQLMIADGKVTADPSAGLVASTGTLGQIIPPSIALVLLGDVMSNAYQRAQNDMGIFSQQTVTVGDLFIGSIVPGALICIGYLIYTIYKNQINPNINDHTIDSKINIINLFKTLALPFLLIFLVLGSIFAGIATPTEAAAIGAFGALIVALVNGKITFAFIKESSEKTAIVSTMIFTILIGASIFSLIFIIETPVNFSLLIRHQLIGAAPL